MLYEVKCIRGADRTFEDIGGEHGKVLVARDVTERESTTIGCRVVVFEDCSLEWTVQYDEYIYVVSGLLTMHTRAGKHELGPGDAIWLPCGTWMIYEAGARTETVISVYPTDWRRRMAPK